MKVMILEDELYPFYDIDTDPDSFCGKEVDVPEETVKRWATAMGEFYKIRKEMKQFYESGKYKDIGEY